MMTKVFFHLSWEFSRFWFFGFFLSKLFLHLEFFSHDLIPNFQKVFPSRIFHELRNVLNFGNSLNIVGNYLKNFHKVKTRTSHQTSQFISSFMYSSFVYKSYKMKIYLLSNFMILLT